MNKLLNVCLLFIVVMPAMASEDVTLCSDIFDNEKRLACYDQQSVSDEPLLTGTVLDSRIKQQSASIENSYSLDAHYPSYILPISYLSNPNEAPYSPVSGISQINEDLENLEVKFQISFRLPLNRDFFVNNSHLWFAYTQLSLWQLYNKVDSAPFRESNYEPELIWSFLVNKSFGDLKLTHLSVALNHQSNGQSEPLSRSWNRIYINGIMAYENWVFSFRPWYRIPEDIEDDDNPDIEDYMGKFDLRIGYKQEDHQFSSVFRHAFDQDDPHSYYELGYSFSINRKFRGYVQFVSGYGESLIDYNYRNKRLSLGIMLNDWF
jgi:phospholipase A1/A2